MRTEELFRFIAERESIREKKDAGAVKPWTTDPILRRYSFCNINRECDKVTRWIADKWRNPHAADPDLWFAMTVARLVNWPDTLAELGYPATWDVGRFVTVLHDRYKRGEKVYSGAYIVGTGGQSIDKAEFLAHHVLTPMWESRANVRPKPGESLASVHRRLCGFVGMGGFMSAQVIADLKYVAPLTEADDWWTFAASGPGSRRGLNRVLNQRVDSRWDENRWHASLMKLAYAMAPLIRDAGMATLHNQDLQGLLCEFDKYERTRMGQGRPRSTYPGSGENRPAA